uniref:C-type lectin domain-containing protein n=1 Tax=Panagrolaimus sp. PS1159 TaxID=55785 RepID=A0AC35GQ51_9BILA
MFFRVFILLALFFRLSEGITCSNGGIIWQNSCLYFNTTETGFVVAERRCQQMGGHLVSVHDAFTNGFIQEKAAQIFDNEYAFWIGGNALMGGGSDWTWTDGTSFNFADWETGEPDITAEKQCIVVSRDHGYWMTEDCTRGRVFVCAVSTAQTNPPNTPPPRPSTTTMKMPTYRNCSFGWVYFEPTNSCYGYNNKGLMMNWTAAESYCNSQGAHLASVHSYEEQMFINEFGLVTWKSVWVGLYSVNGGQTWQWTDGSSFDYVYWYNNQYPQIYSGQNCVLLESSTTQSGFTTNACSYNWYPICKKPFYS